MREKLTGRVVVPVTKDLFPLGQAVEIHGFIDGGCGWEFDAPLHIMEPFHSYHIVGSACEETVQSVIEDLLIDLDCDIERSADDDSWPYSPRYLKRFWRALKNDGLPIRRQQVWMFRATVTVSQWNELDYEFTAEMV